MDWYQIYDEDNKPVFETKNLQKAKEHVYEFGGTVYQNGKIILRIGVGMTEEKE